MLVSSPDTSFVKSLDCLLKYLRGRRTTCVVIIGRFRIKVKRKNDKFLYYIEDFIFEQNYPSVISSNDVDGEKLYAIFSFWGISNPFR